MDELRRQLLRRFFRNPHRMSRNRNFHAFLDRKVRYAARIGRLLRSLRDDLLERELERIAVERDEPVNGKPNVMLELTWDGGYRRSYLTESEFAILREDRQVDALLRDNQKPSTRIR